MDGAWGTSFRSGLGWLGLGWVGLVCSLQVIPDWRGVDSKDGTLSEHQMDRLNNRMQQFFERQKPVVAPRVLTLQQEQLANKHITLALDNALRMGADMDLAQFQVAAESHVFFRPEQQFRTVALEHLPEAVRRVSLGCTQRIVARDRGSDALPKLAVPWGEDRRVLHLHIDQGSIGVPSKLWLFSKDGGALRGWFWLDHAHRRHNNVIDALKVAGLLWLRAEMTY